MPDTQDVVALPVDNLWITRPGVTLCRRRRPGLRRNSLSTPLHPLYQNPNWELGLHCLRVTITPKNVI